MGKKRTLRDIQDKENLQEKMTPKKELKRIPRIQKKVTKAKDCQSTVHSESALRSDDQMSDEGLHLVLTNKLLQEEKLVWANTSLIDKTHELVRVKVIGTCL